MATEYVAQDESVAREDTSWPDLCTVQGLRPTKQQRLEVLASRRVPLAPSYTANTLKEELCLEYVEHFRRQFVQLFPDRKPLFLVARNEAGVPKFVCSTLRPTQLPYKPLYTLQGAASFVASYMDYEPLAHPLELPQFLPSPSTVLSWQAGDSFDLANLLTSLLLGNGFDAYCVVGTAPRWITLRDLSHTKCSYTPPALPVANANVAFAYASGGEAVEGAPPPPTDVDTADAAATAAAAASPRGKAAAATAAGGPPPGVSKYLPKPKPSMASKYLAVMARKEEAAAAAAAADASYESDADETELVGREVQAAAESAGADIHDDIRGYDPLEGQRVHAWVLVRSGRRGVSESVFVEPSTGQVYPLEESPYFTIESVWNHENVWVNMQTQALVPEAPGAPPPPTSAAQAIAQEARALFKERRDAAAEAAAVATAEAAADGTLHEVPKLTLEERLLAGDLTFIPGLDKVRDVNPRAEELITSMPPKPPTHAAAAAAAAKPPVDLRRELAAVGLQLDEDGQLVEPEEEDGSGGVAERVAGLVAAEEAAGESKAAVEEEAVTLRGTGKEITRLLSLDLHTTEDWEHVFVKQTLEDLGVRPVSEPGDGDATGRGDGEEEESGRKSGVPEEDSYVPDADGEHVLDPPTAWVMPISIPREDFEARFGPSKARTTLYQRATLEEFAPLSHPTGLEARLTLFVDNARIVPRHITEVFSHRKDLLIRREQDLYSNTVTEHFAPGHIFRERCIREVLGKSRVTEYYVEGKVSGLKRKEEIFGKKIMWEYTTRPNGLTYRSVTLGKRVGEAPTPGSISIGTTGGAVTSRPAGGMRGSLVMDGVRTVDTEAGVYTVRKMAERYARDPRKPAHKDIEKMTYLLEEGTIQVRYHFVDGHITRNTRVYHGDKADGQMDMLTRDETTPVPKAFEVEIDYKAAMTARINCFNDIRAAQKEAMKEIPQRAWDESNIVLEKDIFEIAQEAADSGAQVSAEAEEEDTDANETIDYLAPFLHEARDSNNLSDKEAAAAVEACRAALADRHKSRARIIQSRLTVENEALEKRQREFSRMNHAEPNAAAAQAAFEEFCLRSLFVIGILEERLKREDEMFEAKMQANEVRMRADQRLVPYFAKADARSTKARSPALARVPSSRSRHK